MGKESVREVVLHSDGLRSRSDDRLDTRQAGEGGSMKFYYRGYKYTSRIEEVIPPSAPVFACPCASGF